MSNSGASPDRQHEIERGLEVEGIFESAAVSLRMHQILLVALLLGLGWSQVQLVAMSRTGSTIPYVIETTCGGDFRGLGVATDARGDERLEALVIEAELRRLIGAMRRIAVPIENEAAWHYQIEDVYSRLGDEAAALYNSWISEPSEDPRRLAERYRRYPRVDSVLFRPDETGGSWDVEWVETLQDLGNVTRITKTGFRAVFRVELRFDDAKAEFSPEHERSNPLKLVVKSFSYTTTGEAT